MNLGLCRSKRSSSFPVLSVFVEVEAIDADGTVGIDKLVEQCNVYAHLFGIAKDHFIAGSYSDLLLAKKSSNV